MTSAMESPPTRYVIVVGMDFSDASTAALAEAVRLAERAGNAELHLAHVIAAPSVPPSTTVSGAAEVAYLAEIDASGKMLHAHLEPLRRRPLRLAGHIRVGRPDREIAQLATDLAADLVVVGMHGKEGLERLLLGSVAESLVRHAPCAVLAHRSKAVKAWDLIEPPCPECVAVREQTHRANLWCPRHSEHHARAHTYHDYPDSFAMGSQSFRS